MPSRSNLEHPAAPCAWLPEAERQLASLTLQTGESALPGRQFVEPSLYETALAFVRFWAQIPGLAQPVIAVTPGRGIQFEWESDGRYFEVELGDCDSAEYFYQDLRNGIEEEGTVRATDPLDRIVDFIRAVDAA